MAEVTTIDVSRNEHGAVLMSLDLQEASGIGEKDAVIVLWREGSGWRPLVRDIMEPSRSLLLPLVSEQTGNWILEAPRFTEADRVEEDTRVPGQRYVLVGEVVDRMVAHGYAAKVMRSARPVGSPQGRPA